MNTIRKDWNEHARALFHKKGFLYLDGGMGTMLQAAGLKGGEAPELWNLSHPEQVMDIHRKYLAAGCDIVTANTFGATRTHLGEQAAMCMQEGIAVAQKAVLEAGYGWVAADIGPLGRLLAPYGDMPFEEAIRQFHEAAAAALTAGADVLLIETMTDLLEIKAAVLGCKEAMAEKGQSVPLLCSVTFDDRGRLLTGADIPGTVAMLEGLRVDALGLNCGHEPKALMENIQALLSISHLPVFISPNASLPVVIHGVTTFPTSPEEFGADMQKIAELGVWGMGGCCGTTPAHIAALRQATSSMPLISPPSNAIEPIISGRSLSLSVGKRPLMIGERLNPTGKPLMKQALRENDLDFLLREAIAQGEAGADVLDVNVGMPEIDEPAMLQATVSAIQTVSGLPLQLDTANPSALEPALRSYCGKPLINSVSGKQKVMDAVFPLAAKYGGMIVALTLDDSGIPDTVEGRLTVARRIITEAEKYGIPKSELLFDALTMPISTNEQAAQITLETVERLTAELGVKTVLGVSNVSFGLPQRPLLTSAFTTMAIGKGLSAAILNPLDETVRTLWDAAVMISGRGEGFSGYLAQYAEKLPLSIGTEKSEKSASAEKQNSPSSQSPENPAIGAIIHGLSGDAGQETRLLLKQGMTPMEIIEKIIMPALTLVGEQYEKGTLFLPQLLQSASAAQSAFDTLRAQMPENSSPADRRIILATVQGDVHDIGKNIVKVLLQNYGFAVTDLGKDVSPLAVLKAVEDTGATVVGLSALMTTTVPAMIETVSELKKTHPQVRIMVGGAVLTPEFAEQIGADGYGRDAMASVRLAQEWLS